VVVFANAGLGLETTRTLVSTGARVIIPARTGSHNSTIRNIFIQQNNYPNFFSGITAI
jgi:NADP-dependent 3-hydroxy acid dehydrogenase YdfG